jgi:hypothetical protein
MAHISISFAHIEKGWIALESAKKFGSDGIQKCAKEKGEKYGNFCLNKE